MSEALNPTWRPQGKNTLADWAADPGANEEGSCYSVEKRQRGGRKKRKKTKEESHASQNWDDVYDPSRPNSYEEYKHSDEKISELREWKDKLYAHRMVRRRTSDANSIDEDPRFSVNRKYASQMGLLITKSVKTSLNPAVYRLLHRLNTVKIIYQDRTPHPKRPPRKMRMLDVYSYLSRRNRPKGEPALLVWNRALR